MTATVATTAEPLIDRLENLPVTLFSSVMGIGGLALAWRRAVRVWDVPAWTTTALFWVGLAVFVVVGVLYSIKWFRHPAAALAELRHPIRMTFVPTITIAMLVLATAGQDLVPALARGTWWVAAIAHLMLTVVVLSAWFGRADIAMGHLTPAWFIPIVGNVVTPLAAKEIGSVEFAWFAYGVGVVFWLALLPLLLHRLLLHETALPAKLLPTLAIFIAPPAVAMLSWGALTGDLDAPVARVLYAAAMMFVILLAAQVGRLRRIPFSLPYWAYSFPLAAAAAAAIAMAGARPQVIYDVVAVALLAMATVLVVVVSGLTLRAASRGQILLPE